MLSRKTLTLIIMTTALANAAIGPTVVNNTSCTIDVDIESDCSGLTTARMKIDANNTIQIPQQFDSSSLEYNKKFCLVLKPTCLDSVMQHVQTLAPFFHNNCIITYNDSANGTKTTTATESCNSPNLLK